MNPQKIAVLAGYAPSLLNFRGSLLATLAKAGHQVVACAPGEDERVRSSLQAMGIGYRPVSLVRGGTNPLQDMSGIVALARLFRDLRPDILLSYTVKPVIYGSLAARLAGIPNIYSMITGLGYAFIDQDRNQRRYSKRHLIGKLIQTLYRVSLASNQKIFFQNPDDIADFTRLGLIDPNKVVLINGSGVDLDHYCAQPMPTNKPLTFLLIARLLRDKGIREYAEAAAIIRHSYPDTLFRLVGPFDTSNPAAITPDELADYKQIEYLGATQDVRPFLADTDVYVLPSYREGTPRTVLEAMATGRAIITTDAPGCRETVIHGENGFLVPVRDAKALAAAMQRFLEDPHLAAVMGRRSRAMAEEKYDVHKVNQVIMAAMGLA